MVGAGTGTGGSMVEGHGNGAQHSTAALTLAERGEASWEGDMEGRMAAGRDPLTSSFKLTLPGRDGRGRQARLARPGSRDSTTADRPPATAAVATRTVAEPDRPRAAPKYK